jgi:predicted DCC family thiol-disulfide oxidoreductase YuxK
VTDQRIASLTVLYDAGCGLCQRARTWLSRQATYVDLEFVPAGSDEARRRYPQLDPATTLSQITVVADTGQVYVDAKAWVMCLWATKAHRATAERMSSPALAPMARRFVAWVADNRQRVGIRGRPATPTR